jgi:hypothetical protein
VPNLVFVGLLVAAFIVPRFAPRGEGFAPAAEATLIFLSILLLAVAVAAWQAARTLQHHARLSSRDRWLGYLPALIGVTGFIGLIAWLRF